MSAREMWAHVDDLESVGSFHVYAVQQTPVSKFVRVLVQEIPEGMPEFKKGDRVELSDGCCGVCVAPPFFGDHDQWWVPVDEEGMGYMIWACKGLTLIPPETSRLIRVTGPEENVEDYMADAASCSRTGHHGVRVEVVNE